MFLLCGGSSGFGQVLYAIVHTQEPDAEYIFIDQLVGIAGSNEDVYSGEVLGFLRCKGVHMDKVFHGFTELFAQLGLPNDASSIRKFIQTHSPLNSSIRLEDAQFWNTAQAALLQEELQGDSDWAEVIDRLNLALRGTIVSAK
jgi:Protein of unknown function (DUF2789)